MIALSLDLYEARLEELPGGGTFEVEDHAMPNYEFCYRDDHGSLAARITLPCPDQLRAKILAHAMKEREYKALEVWDGDTLVYERAKH